MPKPHHYLDFCISVIIQSNDSSRMSENPSEGLSAFIKIFFQFLIPKNLIICTVLLLYSKCL